MALKILYHHTDLFYKLYYLFGTLEFGQWCQSLGFRPQIWVFNAFLGFSGFNCVVAI